MEIRDAAPADLEAVAAIYAREVAEGVATFDTEPRTPASWAYLLEPTPGHHLLVADEGGSVVAWASSSPYRPKHGYRLTRETTVYAAPPAQGRGVGRALYDTLLARLSADGMHLALAGVAQPNPASDGLHRACGFEPVGVMREVGYKQDRFIDVRWWQKLLT
jgi:phosphinothricin acetyltransferase